MTHPLTAAAERLEGAAALDAPAAKIAAVLDTAVRPAKPVLRGDWLGHALHPVLTDLPIGAFTSALILDALGEEAADKLIAAGLLAAPPVFATGWSDWHDEEKRSSAIRRAGLVHAWLNGSAMALQAASLASRRNGERGRGIVLSAAAMGLMGAAGWLGGHLTYEKASRVERPAPSPSPSPSL